MNKKILPILKDLQREEAVEEQLISLYESLLETGAKGCIVLAKRSEFIEGIFILKEDSKRHRLAVLNLIKKYEQ
jgi:hypothetical protein